MPALDDIRADGAEPRAAKANGRSNGHSNGVNGHNGHSKNGRSGHSNGHGNGHAAANGSSGHVATPPQPNGHQRRTRRSPARSSS